MSLNTILMIAAGLLLVLYLIRRRSRMRNDE